MNEYHDQNHDDDQKHGDDHDIMMSYHNDNFCVLIKYSVAQVCNGLAITWHDMTWNSMNWIN